MSHRRRTATTRRPGHMPLALEPLEARHMLAAIVLVTNNIGTSQSLNDFLVAEGHTVTRGRYNIGVPDVTGMDLIIVARENNSGDHSQDTEPQDWNALAVPMINMNQYLYRTSRWGWMDGNDISNGFNFNSYDSPYLLPTHPFVNGLGTVILSADSIDTNRAGNALPVGSIAIADWDTGASRGIFIIPKDTTMFNGRGTAGEIRVGFHRGDEGSWNNINDTGRQILRNMISELTTDQATEAPVVVNTAATDVLGVSAKIGGELTTSSGSVTLYYGDEDGGTNPASWDDSISLGVQSVSFSATISGLTPNTTYHYRAFAENTFGNDWADTASTFTTLTLSLPEIVPFEATDVNFYSAQLGGVVASAGNDSPSITLYFGDDDAGEGGVWDQSIDLGIREEEADFGTTVSQLLSNTEYFFRFTATNAIGTAWTSPAKSFTTDSPVSNSTSILFIGGQFGPTQGADDAVMAFLQSGFGAGNVTYRQASGTNPGDESAFDVLVISSTPGSGNMRGKFQNSTTGIVNWEEAIVDCGSDGEFCMSAGRPKDNVATPHTAELTAAGHPIQGNLANGQITFASRSDGNIELFWTTGNAIGVSEIGHESDSARSFLTYADTGGALLGFDPPARPDIAAARRVTFPMTDNTFDFLTSAGHILLANSITWAANLPPNLPGDLNGDGRVGAMDTGILQSNLGRTGDAGPSDGDLSGDGSVGRADIAIFVGLYGSTPAPAPAASSLRTVVPSAKGPSLQAATGAVLRADVGSRRISAARFRPTLTYVKSHRDKAANDTAIVELSAEETRNLRFHARRGRLKVSQLKTSQRIESRFHGLSDDLPETMQRPTGQRLIG